MSEAPAWMESLIDLVGGCMDAHSGLGPLAFRWRQEEDQWDIMVYPTRGELIGGADDGALVSPGFSFDVQELTTAFEELVDVRWQAQALGPHDQEGQHLSIEGVYDGHQVYLQVLSDAPEDEEPGFKVDLTKRTREP